MTEASPAAGNAEIPPPLALHNYFPFLDDFTGKKPCRNAYIGELLEARDWGDRERTEYEQGQSSLWRLIPPITLEELREADFDPPAYVALSLPLVVWGRHAMHHWEGRMSGRRMPHPLPDIEKMARHVAEQLEQAGRKSSRGGIGRLDALRQDLQHIRLELEATARAKEKAGAAVQDGIATARRAGSDLPFGLRWIPKRFRKATAPGFEVLRRITEPGVAVSMVTGEFARQISWDHDPQVPEPLGVYDYVQALGDQLGGKRLQHVFLHGLIQSVGLSGDLMKAFEQGRNGLWILIPPITATQVAAADLSVEAARALGVALFLRSQHALHHYDAVQSNKMIPPVLAECGEVFTVIKLILDSGRGKEPDPVLDALTEAAIKLAARGVSAGGIVDQRKDEIREIRRQDAEARREAAAEEEPFVVETLASKQKVSFSVLAGASMPRLVVSVILLVGLVAASVHLNFSRETLPPATAYKAVPAVAIIRHRDEIVVRVPPTFMRRPQKERDAALRSLYERFAKELDPHALPVIIVSLTNDPYGGVAGARVWWDAPVEPKEPEKAAKPEAPPAPE